MNREENRVGQPLADAVSADDTLKSQMSPEAWAVPTVLYRVSRQDG